MSGLIKFIAKVVEFLFKLVVTLLCTFFAIIGTANIFRWPEHFTVLMDALNSSLYKYWAAATASMFTLFADMMTFFVFCVTLPTWRGPFMGYYMIDKMEIKDKMYHPEPRIMIWAHFGLLLLDIPTIFGWVIGCFAFWRFPMMVYYTVSGIADQFSKKGYNHPCKSWRVTGYLTFAVGLFDLFTLLCLVLGLLNPIRLFARTFSKAFEKYENEKTRYGTYSPIDNLFPCPEWRFVIITSAFRGALESICLLGYLPCILMPWRWKDIVDSCELAKPAKPPTPPRSSDEGNDYGTSRVGEYVPYSATNPKLYDMPWNGLGWMNSVLGFLDIFVALAGMFTMITWRAPTLIRALKTSRVDYAEDGGNSIRYNAKARGVIAFHFIKIFADLPFILMSVITLGFLMRSYSLIKRLRIIAENPEEDGHHKDSWMYCDYRRPILTEFGKTMICILMVPFFIILLVTGYRIPVLIGELKKIRTEGRDRRSQQGTLNAAAHMQADDSGERTKLKSHEERKLSDWLFFKSVLQVAIQCAHAGVDFPCIIICAFAFLLLIRAHKTYRLLTLVPPRHKNSPASYRRQVAVEAFFLSFRDWFCVLLTPLTLLSPPRFVGVFTQLAQSMRREPDPTPLVLITEVQPKFIHNAGWQLQLKGIKPKDLRIRNAQIQFNGEAFWRSFSAKIGSVVRMMANTLLPYELTPKYINLDEVNTNKEHFTVVIDMKVKVKRRTIIKKVKLLDQKAPLEIHVSCDDRTKTLFCLTTDSETLLGCEDAGVPMPLTGLRHCPNVRLQEIASADAAAAASTDEGVTREFSEFEVGSPTLPAEYNTASSPAATAPNATDEHRIVGVDSNGQKHESATATAMPEERTAEAYGPYFCDHYWLIVLMQIGQMFMDLFAIFCFFFTHLVPFRAWKLYRQLYLTTQSYSMKQGSEYLEHLLRGTVRQNGKKHLDLFRKQQVYANELSKAGDNLSMSSPYCPELNHFLTTNEHEKYNITRSTEGNAEAANDIMEIYAANLKIAALHQLKINAKKRHALLSGDSNAPPAASNAAADLFGRAINVFRDVHRSLSANGEEDPDGAAAHYEREAAEEERRRRGRRLRFGRGIDEEDYLFTQDESVDAYLSGGVRITDRASADEASEMSGLWRVIQRIRDDLLTSTASLDADLKAKFLLSVEFFEDSATAQQSFDEELFARNQQAVLHHAGGVILPMMRKTEGGVPFCSEMNTRTWDESRGLCYYHALMVIPDIFVFIACLLILATVYRAYTLFSTMYRSRHWRSKIPMIFCEILIDFGFLLMWLFVMITLRYSIEVNIALVWTMFRHFSFYRCRYVIWEYFCAVWSDFGHLLSLIFTTKIIKYCIAVVLVGIVTPAELISHNIGKKEICACDIWAFVLLGTLAYYSLPFIVVYASEANYITLLYLFGAFTAVLLLLILFMVLRKGIKEKRNHVGVYGDEVQVVTMEGVTLSHLPVTTKSAMAAFLVLFEGFQLCSLAISQKKWTKGGGDASWLSWLEISEYATLTNVSVGDEQFPIGFWLSIGVCFFYFVIVGSPLVINEVLDNKRVNITGQRPWQVATFLLGPFLALSVSANLVGFTACSESETLNMLDDVSYVYNGTAAPSNYTNSTSYIDPSNISVVETFVNKTIRYMTVGSNPMEQWCWTSTDHKGYGALALILMVFYAPTVALKGTRWSEPIRGTELRFHELFNTCVVVAHIFLGSLWGFLHRQPEAYCAVQIVILLILIGISWRNVDWVLPAERNSTSTVVCFWRNGAYIVALLSTVVTLAALAVDEDTISTIGIVMIAVFVVGILVTAFRVMCSAPDDNMEGDLTVLLNDIGTYQRTQETIGNLIAWNPEQKKHFERSLSRCSTSDDLSDLLIDLDKHLTTGCYKKLFFNVRNVWTSRVYTLRFSYMSLVTLQKFEEQFQSLKNGTYQEAEASRAPEEHHADGDNIQQESIDTPPHREPYEPVVHNDFMASAIGAVNALTAAANAAAANHRQQGGATPPPAQNPAFGDEDL